MYIAKKYNNLHTKSTLFSNEILRMTHMNNNARIPQRALTNKLEKEIKRHFAILKKRNLVFHIVYVLKACPIDSGQT